MFTTKGVFLKPLLASNSRSGEYSARTHREETNQIAEPIAFQMRFECGGLGAV